MLPVASEDMKQNVYIISVCRGSLSARRHSCSGPLVRPVLEYLSTVSQRLRLERVLLISEEKNTPQNFEKLPKISENLQEPSVFTQIAWTWSSFCNNHNNEKQLGEIQRSLKCVVCVWGCVSMYVCIWKRNPTTMISSKTRKRSNRLHYV